MMKYLKGTRKLVLRLEASKCNFLKWYVDASYTVHKDMKSHTGGMLTMGKGAVCGISKKQKLNTKSSTESELVGVEDVLPQVLWTNYFMKDHGWHTNHSVVFQDNKSAILLEQNGKLSSSNRTKHINVRYFFIKDCIERKEVKIEFLGTDEMVADYFTKPLQGTKFIKFCNQIMNIDKNIETNIDDDINDGDEGIDHVERS